jgi:hypothetical protein
MTKKLISETQLRKLIRKEILSEMIPRKVDRVRKFNRVQSSISQDDDDIVSTSIPKEDFAKSDPEWRAVKKYLGLAEYKRRFLEPEAISLTNHNNRWGLQWYISLDKRLIKLQKQIKNLFTQANGIYDSFIEMIQTSVQFGFQSRQFKAALRKNDIIVGQVEPLVDEANSIGSQVYQISNAKERAQDRERWLVQQATGRHLLPASAGGPLYEPARQETPEEYDSRMWSGVQTAPGPRQRREMTAAERESWLMGGGK